MRYTMHTLLRCLLVWLGIAGAVLCFSWLFPSVRTIDVFDMQYIVLVLAVVAVPIILYWLLRIRGTEAVWKTVLKFCILYVVSVILTSLLLYFRQPDSICSNYQIFNYVMNFSIVFAISAIIVVYKMIQSMASTLASSAEEARYRPADIESTAVDDE